MEARSVLASVYNRFTEGFETGDLARAKTCRGTRTRRGSDFSGAEIPRPFQRPRFVTQQRAPAHWNHFLAEQSNRSLRYGLGLAVADCKINQTALHIEGVGRGLEVKCVRGSLWITQHGDLEDRVIGNGQSFVLDRPGLSLVTALGEPAVVVVKPGSVITRQPLRHAA